MWSDPLLDHSLEAADFLRPQLGIVVVERSEVGREFIRFGSAKGCTVKQLQSRWMKKMVDQTQAGVGRAAEVGVMVITKACAQSELRSEGKFILAVEGPVH